MFDIENNIQLECNICILLDSIGINHIKLKSVIIKILIRNKYKYLVQRSKLHNE